jgi:hypothetical protein
MHSYWKFKILIPRLSYNVKASKCRLSTSDTEELTHEHITSHVWFPYLGQKAVQLIVHSRATYTCVYIEAGLVA